MRAPIYLLGLALLALSAAPATLARADEAAITPQAREHFAAGVRMLKDPAGARYEEAYQEFNAAYARSPSLRILGNIGLCAMKLERDEEAIAAYEKYLEGVPDLDPVERAQVEADLGALKASLVRLTITVDAADVRIVDVRTPVQGAPITNVYGPFAKQAIELGIHPGHHTITIKREGSTDFVWALDAVPGAQESRAFSLQSTPVAPQPAPAAPPAILPVAPAAAVALFERPTPGSVFAVGIVAGGALLGGVVTGATALQRKHAYDEANTGHAPVEAGRIRSEGQRLNVATDVLLGAAILGTGVATYLYITRPLVKASSSGASLRLRFGAGAALEGTF